MMTITSPAFEDGGVIPRRFTCDGEGHSPPLLFGDVPPGTKSLALIMDDPDVPTSIRAEGEWEHWLVWNMPPDVPGIPQGDPAPGMVGRNTSGTHAYAAPCPPDREHRYFFRLYALDCVLDLAAAHGSKLALLRAMEGHVLAEAELEGRYERGKG